MITRNRWMIRSCKSFVILTALFVAPLLPMAAQTLEVCSNEAVAGPDILLREIIKNPSTLPSGWGDRAVMRSPDPGKPIDYSISSIAYALQQYPDMHEVTLRGSVNVTIARTGVALARESMVEAVEQYVSENEEWLNQKVDIQCDPPKEDVRIPDGDIGIKVTGHKAQAASGYYSFEMEVLVDGSKIQEFDVRVRVITMKSIWVFAGQKSRGHVLAVEDLVTAYLPAAEASRFVSSEEEIVGWELNRDVRPDQRLARHLIVQPICVQRGEVIQVTAERGSLSIVLRAKALAAGRRGERVLCVNEKSKRRLHVRLVGARLAMLEF